MLKPVPKQDLKCAQTGADPQLAGNAASMERANNVGAALEPRRATVFSVHCYDTLETMEDSTLHF